MHWWVCPHEFGIKRSRSKYSYTKNYFQRFTDISLHLSPWNFTQSLSMSWEYGPFSKKPKATLQLLLKNGFVNNCFPSSHFHVKIHPQIPHYSRMCPLNFGVKGSMSQCNAMITENYFWCILKCLYTYRLETVLTDSPWEGCTLWI